MAVDPRPAEVERLVTESHPGDDLFARFVRAVLPRLLRDDEGEPEAILRKIEELYALVETTTAPTTVRVFNPSVEQNGYATPGTVVVVHSDDAPFLFTSVTNEIRAHGLGVLVAAHPVIGTSRNADGRLVDVLPAREAPRRESIQRYELDRRLVDIDLPGIERAVRRVLGEVHRAVADFEPMRDRVERMIRLVESAARRPGVDPAEAAEDVAFLRWLLAGNFIFLGYREYRIVELDGEPAVALVPGTGLGLLADEDRSRFRGPVPLADLPAGLAERYRRGAPLVVTKTGSMTTIQRWDRMDYVGARILDEQGRSVGEARLVGLFSTKALLEPSFRVPILRRKFEAVIRAEDIIEGSHDHRAIIQLFDGFPKIDLFAAEIEDLRDELMDLLVLGERQEVRLFIRQDIHERSFSVLVALPRDRFNAELRKAIQALLLARLGGSSVDYHLTLGEAAEAFMHFTIWVDSPREVRVDELEQEVIELARGWDDRVVAEIDRRSGRADGGLRVGAWAERLPDYYRASTTPEVAAADIANLEQLAGRSFVVGVHNEAGPTSDGRLLTRVTLYRTGGKRPLSDLVPPLEDHGLRVVEEVPTRLSGPGDIFIHDFGVVGPDGHRLDVAEGGRRLEESLTAVWGGWGESDSLSALILTGGLDHDDVEILRAYRTYWRRVRPVFTVGYVDSILVGRPGLSADLVALFRARFDPGADPTFQETVRERVVRALDAIPVFDEDRVFRAFLQLIEATVRTNAFVPGRRALALKLRSGDVPDMPSPVPHVEIFVLGRGVEGIHLRAGPVARGGIRWSERREDYRTEALGLMKAQTRKNALIVPTGAKGAFVLRRPPVGRPQIAREAEEQYEVFIESLLDVTDNLVDGAVVHPPRVRPFDGGDPYLVVAADRGTATFSDLANGIARRRRFWLGDAFASGGTTGYDHKQLGITARGAWVALDEHLAELGHDPAAGITFVGIGDMSGDVFGNGLLASRRIRLVAAFDHRHIFVDPDPEEEASYEERRRLFSVPASSWDDYDRRLISAGGGVWSRDEKRIDVSPEARRALGIEAAAVTADELVRAILTAPVDVLWNGGIGTFVKAAAESPRDVEDHTNDAIRVDATSLRCRIVVEGGNLGLTQAARVEYALAGGRINTDFIDNSGGVDCSDREVNLKILLDLGVAQGRIEPSDRDALVASAAPEVVDAVLADCARQVRALARETAAAGRTDAYEDLMGLLESEGICARSEDGLPTSDALADRVRSGGGLTRPELAILLADAKRSLEAGLLRSALPDSDSFVTELAAFFPPSAVAAVGDVVGDHPLRRELVATIVANDVVDSEGATFLSRFCFETGVDVSEAVWAYRAARAGTRALARRKALLDAGLGDGGRRLLAGELDRVLASVARWYVVHRADAGASEDLDDLARRFDECLAAAADLAPEDWRRRHRAAAEGLGAPDALAGDLASLSVVPLIPDVLDVARQAGQSPLDILAIFLRVGAALGLDALAAALPGDEGDRWSGRAIHAVEDELLGVRRRAVEHILAAHGGDPDPVTSFLADRSHVVARLVRFRRGAGEIPPGDVDRLIATLGRIRSIVDAP